MAKARQAAAMSQEQMARKLGVSRRTIVRLETQGAAVPPTIVLAYHVACGVDLAWLDGGLPSWEGGKSPWYGEARTGSGDDARPEGLEPPTFWTGSPGRQYCTLDIDLAFWKLVK